MSEAELFVLRARLQGGILNKARRGALKLPLPIGLCYTENEVIVLDPDLLDESQLDRPTSFDTAVQPANKKAEQRLRSAFSQVFLR